MGQVDQMPTFLIGLLESHLENNPNRYRDLKRSTLGISFSRKATAPERLHVTGVRHG